KGVKNSKFWQIQKIDVNLPKLVKNCKFRQKQKEMIKRIDYLESLKALKDKNIIKILTGVRRSGKSTVMQLFRNYLEETGVTETQIVFLNFEQIEHMKWLNDFEGLYYHIVSQ